MNSITDVNLNIANKLKDKGYFHRFFRRRTQGIIASQIRELRERREFTQTKLAKAMGTGQSAVARIEDAKYSGWSFTTLLKVAEILDARLSIAFEPMEDVIAEYERMERPAVASGEPFEALRGSVYGLAIAIGSNIAVAQESPLEKFGSRAFDAKATPKFTDQTPGTIIPELFLTNDPRNRKRT